MKRCPITYEVIKSSENYSRHGLHMLSPALEDLKPLPYTASEQRSEALSRVGKMSIQGVQAKLSAQLKVKNQEFSLVDQYGHYILKPQSAHFPELPENEAVTMTLADIVGIEVPVHGLIYCCDNSMTYFIKRFDRAGHSIRIATEDFAQLSGSTRDTKYNSSMENVARIIETFCMFPKIEFVKLLKLTLFNFLIGNEDMHLKNFSLITRDNLITLSPAYDLLNSTIALQNASEELALPLHGKKKNISKRLFISYYASERLGLNDAIIKQTLDEFTQAIPKWHNLIDICFLSDDMKKKYLELLDERCERLGL